MPGGGEQNPLAFRCPPTAKTAMDGVFAIKLARGVEVGILAHLDVGLGFLPLHIFKRSALPPVSGLDPLLGTLKEGDQPLGVPAELPVEPPGDSLGPGGAIAFDQNLVIEGEELSPGAGVSLAATAADQLPIDPG